MIDEQALDLYIRAIEAEHRAVVCSRHQSDFAARFEVRYMAWRKANTDALTRGEALARERNMLGDGRTSVNAFAKTNASLLDSIPEDDRQRRSDELLTAFLVKDKP